MTQEIFAGRSWSTIDFHQFPTSADVIRDFTRYRAPVENVQLEKTKKKMKVGEPDEPTHTN